MNKNTLLAIGWPVTVASAFFLGHKIKQVPAYAGSSKNTEKNVVHTVTKKSSSTDSSSFSSKLTMEALRDRLMSSAQISKADFKDNFGIQKIMQLDEPIKRADLLLSVIENMSINDFHMVVDNFRSLGITEQRMGEYKQLLHAWAKADPNAALAYSQENQDSTLAENTILATWVKDNPSAAIEWARENHQGDEANPYLVGVIHGLATTDRALATELLEDMPRSAESHKALDHLLHSLASEQPDAGLAWLDTLGDEKLKQRASIKLVNRLATVDPAAVEEWVSNLEDEVLKGRSLSTMAYSLAQENLPEATDWVSSLAPDKKVNAARGMINDYVKEDPGAAAEWMQTMQNQEGYQSLLNSYIWTASSTNEHEHALNQANNIDDPEKRNTFYNNGLNQWAYDDPEAAAKWLTTSNVPHNIKKNTTKLINKINNGQAKRSRVISSSFFSSSNSGGSDNQ